MARGNSRAQSESNPFQASRKPEALQLERDLAGGNAVSAAKALEFDQALYDAFFTQEFDKLMTKAGAEADDVAQSMGEREINMLPETQYFRLGDKTYAVETKGDGDWENAKFEVGSDGPGRLYSEILEGPSAERFLENATIRVLSADEAKDLEPGQNEDYFTYPFGKVEGVTELVPKKRK